MKTADRPEMPERASAAKAQSPWYFRFTPRGFALWLALVTLFASLSTLYFGLGGLADGGSGNWPRILLRETTGWVTFGLLFFPLVMVVRRFPPLRKRWRRVALVYSATILSLGVLHTTLMWQLRRLVYPWFGFGEYDYGDLPLRYGMELAGQVQGFTFMIVAIVATEAIRRAREQELQAARLEGHLARAELQNLRLQLQPHFLFNTLHAISSTMYHDPVAADEMLDQLSTLLRASLKTVRELEVPLAEERELLEAYLAILGARFGDRFQIRLDIEDDLALVPSMLLQPLVENAVRHGGVENGAVLSVSVRSRKVEDRLQVTIEDDGIGPLDTMELGVGLGSCRDRLEHLYGNDHLLEVGPRNRGGFYVRIELPFQRWEAP